MNRTTDNQPTAAELLLDALEDLTKPIRSKVMQPDILAPTGVRVTTVILPSLLDQIRDAITASMGGNTSGASDPSTRNILDMDALYRLIRINSMVQDWARMVGATITKDDTGKTLVAWYQKYTLYPTPEGKDRFYTRKLNGWVAEIKGKLDQPKVMDLPNQCPICQAVTWWSPVTHEEYQRPLIIEYRPDGPDMVQKARALCRACEQVWGVRELQWELEQAEKRHAADADVTAG